MAGAGRPSTPRGIDATEKRGWRLGACARLVPQALLSWPHCLERQPPGCNTIPGKDWRFEYRPGHLEKPGFDDQVSVKFSRSSYNGAISFAIHTATAGRMKILLC